MAAAADDVADLIGHMPVLRRRAAGLDLLFVEVHRIRAHIGPLGRADDTDAAVACFLPAGVAALHDLLTTGRVRAPEPRPVLAVAVARGVEFLAAPLLPQPEVHPRRLRLDDERERALGLARVEMAMHRLGVDDREVAL